MNKRLNLRILNTRPLGQNKALSQTIRDLGCVSIELPAIKIEPVSFQFPVLGIDQVIFISTNAIYYYFASHPPLLPHIIVSAIGQASASSITQFGMRVHHVPHIEDSEHLLQMTHLQNIQDQNILLIKGEGGRQLIEHTLSARGARVTPLAVYKRTLPDIDQKDLDFLWRQDAVDIILFTSEDAMYNLFKLFGEKAKPWLCSKPCLVMSERLAETARRLGIQTILVDHLKEGLNALVHYIKG